MKLMSLFFMIDSATKRQLLSRISDYQQQQFNKVKVARGPELHVRQEPDEEEKELESPASLLDGQKMTELKRQKGQRKKTKAKHIDITQDKVSDDSISDVSSSQSSIDSDQNDKRKQKKKKHA